LHEYERLLGKKRALPNGFIRDMILTAPSRSIMNKLARSVLALYSYDKNPDDASIDNVLRQSIDLIAYFPALIAAGYQAKQTLKTNSSIYLHSPDAALSTAENILRLTRPSGAFTDFEAKMLDICLILHAEHGGGNNSSFTTHVVTSTGTDTYSAVAAAVGSLKGPKHGGANIEVIEMIAGIKKNVRDITDENKVKEYLIKLLKGEAGDGSGLIYGLGHAVYTVSDPRAVLLKKMARKLAAEKGLLDDFALYEYIEKQAPLLYREIKGVDKPMPANVDLYSGFVYKALDIPNDLATPIFAAARISGWCAHRLEELAEGARIMRPAYKCVQPAVEYLPLAKRVQS
jgi:citrate synthase